jgi:hypothetical protein
LAVFFSNVAIAGAHSSRVVKQGEVTVFADRIVLRLAYQVSEPRFAADLRERFDRDADGTLSAGECVALERYARHLAHEDLRVEWDGRVLEPEVSLDATGGLERLLPSAYPIQLAWTLVYRPGAGPGPHVLRLEDRELRWNSDFEYRLRLAPGVECLGDAAAGRGGSFAFAHGKGSFRIKVSTGTGHGQ